MKIWIKFLIGIGVGIGIAIIIPEGEAGLAVVNDIALLCGQIGKYAVFPLVIFSFIIAVYELKLEKRLLLVFRKFALYVLCLTGVLALIGTVSGIFLPVQKLPGPGTTTPVISGIPFLEVLKKQIFPDNILAVFTQAGFSLFPLIILALLVGLNIDYEKTFTRPVAQFVAGTSRILYHVNSL